MRITCSLIAALAWSTSVTASPTDLFVGKHVRNEVRATTNAEVTSGSTSGSRQAAAIQLVATMPKCGLACIETVVSASPCKLTDLDCTCNNATMTMQAQQCILKSCTIKEALSTKNTTERICGRPMRDRSGVVASTAIGPMILALVSYVVRIISKVHIPWTGGSFSTELWWDDLIITLAVIIMIPYASLTVIIADLGFGTDVWTIPFANITKILKRYWILELGFVAVGGLVKISLLLTYLRFFSSPRFRTAVFATLALATTCLISFEVATFFQCTPVSYAWHRWDGEHEGHCVPLSKLTWGSSTMAIVLDFLILGLPIWELWKMNLNTRKKLLVMLMFSVGFVVTLISIMRLHSLVSFAHATNFTWEYVTPGVWSKLESYLAVVCACMPAIRQFIRRFSPRLTGSTRSGGTNTNMTTTQSGLSGRTSFWMLSLHSNVRNRTLNSETGTIAISDVGKSADTEVRAKGSSHATVEEMD